MPPSSRRALLQAGFYGAGVLSLGLLACQRRAKSGEVIALSEPYGPLLETRDLNTGLPLLMLPEGFRYRTFSWAGSRMDDGYPVPELADGMGVVASAESRSTLVRNHELKGSPGPIGNPASAYDVTGAGTTTLVFDTADERLVESYVSLGGTLNNCAGGVTPWGTWLSCEEAPVSPGLAHLRPPFRQLNWDTHRARRPHGYVFEVPAEGAAQPEPIVAMGQFYHEAVAIDPRDGIAYQTEDTSPHAGFYRYVPKQREQLAAGGVLQMMRVGAAKDMRAWLELSSRLVPGETLPVEWVDIERPEEGFRPGNREGDGLVTQGLRAGGSSFASLEGCAFHDGNIYFTSKNGGLHRAGTIFEFNPAQQSVRLVYESPGNDTFSGPDNIIMSPRGSLLVCEDRVSPRKAGQLIAGLGPDGSMFRFCQINPRLRGLYEGHDLGATVRVSEWAGACFSADGDWLFCNIYSPGVTVAITGPWQPGLI